MTTIQHETENLILTCGCKDFSHQICFTYDPDDLNEGCDEVFVYLNSDVNSSFLVRLWSSIKYILKLEPITFYEVV